MQGLPPPAVFRLPKNGSSRAEYEDAVAWNSGKRRFAVADGASASAFARLWAQLLVRAYVADRLNAASLEHDLCPLQARWSTLVELRDLPWYAVEQARRGAFAALVGLNLLPHGQWTALAVGDSCLFQIRDGTLLRALPLSEPEAFDNRPLLIGSRPTANSQLREQGAIVCAEGCWQSGDTFLLMSDALAAMFLRELGSKHCSPLSVLEFGSSTADFRRWVSSMRAGRLLRNDDVSLLRLAVPADAAA